MDRSRSARLTPPDDLPPVRRDSHSPRRHTVRIVKRRTPSRVAILSLMMAMSAAAIAFFAWRWWRPAAGRVAVYQRTISDIEMSWKCEVGHSFIAPGQVADRLCATCNQPAYVVAAYECARHGVFEVSVRYTTGDDGFPRISQRRVGHGNWVPAKDPVSCPHCQAPMVRKQTDPLDTLNRGKKKGG